MAVAVRRHSATSASLCGPLYRIVQMERSSETTRTEAAAHCGGRARREIISVNKSTALVPASRAVQISAGPQLPPPWPIYSLFRQVSHYYA